MKKHLLILCAFCALYVLLPAAETAAAPAPSAEVVELRTIAATALQQRDGNAKLAQDTQIQLQLAQQKIAALTQELNAAKAKLAAHEKKADEKKPEEKPAQ